MKSERNIYSQRYSVSWIMVILFFGIWIWMSCGIDVTDEGPALEEYDFGPVITSVDPMAGPPGTNVNINGKGFSPDTSGNIITFNGIEAPVNSASDTLLETSVPDSADTGPVVVRARDMTGEGPTFTVEEAMPAIRSIEPENGVEGTEVTIKGINFSPDPTDNIVTFNGVDAPVYNASDTLLITEVPDGAATGPIEVAVGEETAVGPVFTVITEGDMQVIVSTAGSDPDPDGYTLLLDGGAQSQITAIRDTVYFNNVEEGSHDLELTEIADNCVVPGDNPRVVNIVAGDTTTTIFDVSCETIIQNQIVYHSDRDGNLEIYVMDPDGSNQTNLTDNPASDFDVAVSPDGSQLAFGSDRDGNEDLYIMDADGLNVTQLTFTASGITNSQPTWSPDGSQIAFTRFTGAQNFEIYVISTDGSDETNITNNSADDMQPGWSPDGSQIAFVSNRDSDQDPEIFIMDSDGTDVTQLTSNTVPDLAPSWSPDGNQIAYQDNSLQSGNIFIMDADGSNQTEVTNNFDTDHLPSWSPDGSQIVFRTDRDGNLEIYRINIDGSGLVNLSNNTAEDEHPHWSPVE